MNIYCNNCDSTFPETTQFCPNCGTPTPFYYTRGEGSAVDAHVIPTHPGTVQQKIETDYSTVLENMLEKNRYVPHNPYTIIPPPPPPPTPQRRRRMGFIIGITTIIIVIPLLILSSFGVRDLLVQRAKPPTNNLVIRPTATPTTVPATATPSIASPTASINLIGYSGDGYIIGYPAEWTIKKAGNVVQITRDDTVSMLIETVESPAGVSPTGGVQGALGGFKGTSKNFQEKIVTSPITLDNTQWEQGAATADNPTSGANSTVYVITTKFPDNGNKLIAIIYGAGTSEFDKDNTEDFQPMLQSFKFS